MMQATSKVVGTITIGADVTHRENFETASWYRDWLIEPGTYQVTAHFSGGYTELPHPYLCTAKVRGTVTASLFINRLFHASSSEVDRDKGKAGETSMQVSLHDPRFEPNEDWLRIAARLAVRMVEYRQQRQY